MEKTEKSSDAKIRQSGGKHFETWGFYYPPLVEEEPLHRCSTDVSVGMSIYEPFEEELRLPPILILS
jgi:hypothetical protein